MVLLADLGNRSLVFSLYENREEIASFKTLTDKFKTSDEYKESLMQFLRLQNLDIKKIEGAILESVVPSLTKRVEKAINNTIKKECLILSKNLKTGLMIKTDNPLEVGSNLISSAIGAINNYHEDSLVICLSSCLTMMVVTKEKQFLGGCIFPGLRESVSNMTERNAQLMEIDLTKTKRVIGKSTKECINSGVINGYTFLIEKMADEMCKEFDKPLKRIVTGPDSGIIKINLGVKYTYNSHLLFDGLYDIYEKNKNL